MPQISVIVPVYKVEPYLHRCVDSILAQTFTDFELILVDDGSPDSCGSICDEYAAKDSRIHVIHQANGGLSAARNAALDWISDHSRSQWINCIDSDDWVHPRYLELLYRAAVEHNAGISRCLYLETDGPDEVPEPAGKTRCMTPEEMYLNWYAAFAWGKLYRRECFQDIRYPNGKVFEDVAIWYKLLFAQERVAVVEDKLYFYFVRPDSIARVQWNPANYAQIEAWLEQLEYFDKHPNKKLMKTALYKAFWVLEHQYNGIWQSTAINAWEKAKYSIRIKNDARRIVFRYKTALKRSGYYSMYADWAYPAARWLYWSGVGLAKRFKRKK